jgi:putative transposase
MPKGLRRLTGHGDLHFITFCCYQRRSLLETAQARNAAVQILCEVRAQYGFALLGYVIMPDHVHLLISESAAADPAKVIQVFKQRLSRQMRGKAQKAPHFSGEDGGLRRFWQRRYHDFNVYSRTKVQEKLHYMHANPVRQKLVEHPGDWPWSSWSYWYRGGGLLRMDAWTGDSQVERQEGQTEEPTLCKKTQRVGHPGGFSWLRGAL